MITYGLCYMFFVLMAYDVVLCFTMLYNVRLCFLMLYDVALCSNMFDHVRFCLLSLYMYIYIYIHSCMDIFTYQICTCIHLWKKIGKKTETNWSNQPGCVEIKRNVDAPHWQARAHPPECSGSMFKRPIAIPLEPDGLWDNKLLF